MQAAVDAVYTAAPQPLRAFYDLDVGQQALYDRAVAAATDAGLSQRHFFVLALFLAHTATFYTQNTLYHIAGKLVPGALEPLRFQPNKRASSGLVAKAIALVSFYHFASPVMPWFLYDAAVARQPELFTGPVPGLGAIILQLAACYACTDCLFYWGHRILHIGPLYRAIHKQHHEFTVSVGWAAEYAHPLEWLLCNVVPVMSGFVLLKLHFFMWVLWTGIAIMGTTAAHSGIWYPSLELGWHDFHHSHNKGNFGSTPFWDKVCGTDVAYRKVMAKKAGKAA